MLDAASLTDNTGNKADFKNVIVIMTSNAGSQDANTLGFNANLQGKNDVAIKSLFSPELRSRIDRIIAFNPLGLREYKLIAKKYIDDIATSLKARQIHLSIDSKALNYLASQSMDKSLGAREMKKIIDSQIKLALSDEILFGALKKGGNVKITIAPLPSPHITLLCDKPSHKPKITSKRKKNVAKSF